MYTSLAPICSHVVIISSNLRRRLCNFLGTGNVLKIQSLLHLCSEYFGDKEDETAEPGEGGEKGSEGNKKGTETGGGCGHRARLSFFVVISLKYSSISE